MRFRACGCDPQYHRRRPRSWWMRLFWTRRYYECADCRQHLFIPTDSRPQEHPSLHPPEAHAQ